MFDYLIVGAGLYGAVCAYELKKAGKKCLVIDKRDHIAGNIYTKEVSGVLKPLVAVELQLRSDFLFLRFHCQTNRIQYEIYGLLCAGFVSNNTVIVQITDHRQIQHTFRGVDI